MLWSIEGCQNRVSTDQYHLTVSRAQLSTHVGRVFFQVIRWQVTSFQMIAGTIKIFISNWPRKRKFSQLLQSGKTVTFSHHGHALVTLKLQLLCSDWSNFDRWVYEENLCSTWNLCNLIAELSWQSFVSTCDLFNCLFSMNVENEIQLLSRVFCYSWLVFFSLGFWLRNALLVKVGNPISGGIVFVFHLAWCVIGLKSLKLSGIASPMVSLSNYCIWLLFVCLFLLISWCRA